MDNVSEAFEIRQKYKHFRILVIGRANAGKTTLLKRVCNTTDEPCIYDEQNNSLIEPTSERGIHDIHRPFAFASNPQFIFHDSPGFETGDETQLKEVQQFIKDRAKATEVDDQLHAIWFCVVTDASRPLLKLEKRFFDEERPGNVPVIAIFTKFDDLITQNYDEDLEEDENRAAATDVLEKKFRNPLSMSSFPPKAHVCLEDMQEDNGNHQEQVKELTRATADSLDNLALKMLFVSVQQNNLELCIRYAVQYRGQDKLYNDSCEQLVRGGMTWFRHSYYKKHNYEKRELKDLCNLLLDRRHLLLGHRHLPRRGFFHNYVTQITAFINAQFHVYSNPSNSLAIFAAIIICLDNSFWHCTNSCPFPAAFKTAFQFYQSTGTQAKLEMALLDLVDDNTNFRSRLTHTILEHRLSHKDMTSEPSSSNAI